LHATWSSDRADQRRKTLIAVRAGQKPMTCAGQKTKTPAREGGSSHPACLRWRLIGSCLIGYDSSLEQ